MNQLVDSTLALGKENDDLVKMRLCLVLLFFALILPSHAQEVASGPAIDPLVVAQLKSDCSGLLRQNVGAKMSDDQQKVAADGLASQVIKDEASALVFSQDQIQSLRKGNSIYSDAEAIDAYSKLKGAAQGRPMPVFVEYYKGVLGKR